jgi:ribonuclease BN (tRNA processing enzyme)
MHDTMIYFLGTNGWFSSPTGETLCILIETDSYSIILDAGNGLRRLDEFRFNKDKPAYLLLSHFHIDHISGLHFIAKFRFPQGLFIICYEGGKDILSSIIRQPYTISFQDLPFRTQLIELPEGRHSQFPFSLECRELLHSTKCYGYRLEIHNKVISFCTDTGRCPSAIDLSRQADLLITECALQSGQTSAHWPHLNPEEAALLAKEAQAKKLVLVHFDGEEYVTLSQRKKAEQAAQKIFPHTLAADVNLKLEM